MAATKTEEMGGGETPALVQGRLDLETDPDAKGNRGDIMSSPAVTPDAELKDVELNEMDTEKQPMNASSPLAGSPGSGEKNGVVFLKVEEEEEEDRAALAKFTGLSKEELLEVASTPAWVRARWALLILFWLGWLGMLAGAIVIIVQAPRCKDLPKQAWWQKGGLYRIQPVDGFQDSDADGQGDLTGLKQRMDYISSLKVKGLVIGPLHINPKDDQNRTNLQEVDPSFGTLEDFREILQAAKKKSLKVVLDLTPNYQSEYPWFNQSIHLNVALQDKMKEAIEFWLKEGVSGIQLGSVEEFEDTQILSDWKNLTEQYNVDDHGRVLIAVTQRQDAQGILALLNQTAGVDVLTSDYLAGVAEATEDGSQGNAIASLINSYIREAKWAGWSVARPSVGELADSMGEHLLRLYHMLLYTLPGTPFTDYGDEIGLRDLPGKPAASSVVRMQWDDSANFGFSKAAQQPSSEPASNVTVQLQSGNKDSVLTFFQQLSELRGKERSLLHGEYFVTHSSSPSVFAYLRVWDQNKRFLVVLNFASQETTVSITHPDLPPDMTVELSTNPSREKQQLALQNLKLGPSEGLMLSFIYVA
uniref:Amino acid transporter heavy chain SLC3A2 isoform X1 n=2 Tax=Pogona vitticeps TaxID=103695 RepID=A0A6J0TWY0_9SAUR